MPASKTTAGQKKKQKCLADSGQNRLVMREDWKRIWDDEVLHKVIATMLHPENPKI